MRTMSAWAILAVFAFCHEPAWAEIPGGHVTIGVLTDMNAGNADATGQGSVVAAQLAAEDAASWLPGVTIEVIQGDHQNKADIASSITRDWMANRGVNVVADVPFSSAGLAVSEAVRNAPRTIFIASGSGTSDLTGRSCSPNSIQWTYDTYATGNVVARALNRPRREDVVLRHRGLCLWRGAGTRHLGDDPRAWRNSRRQRQEPGIRVGLFVVSAGGTKQFRPGGCHRQCVDRHDQPGEAGP